MSKDSQRRELLKGLLAFGCGYCISSETFSQSSPPRKYCAHHPVPTDLNNLVALGEGGTRRLIELNSGSNTVVSYIEDERERLARFYGVNAPIYFDVIDRYDAYMDIDRRFIGLGDAFIAAQAGKAMARVAGILAHEWGHVFQVVSGINRDLENIRQQSVKYVELHADYLAGAYIAWRQKYRVGTLSNVLEELFFELGGRAANSENYHGTALERKFAFFQGHDDFAMLITNTTSTPAVKAAAMGLMYVKANLR